MKTLRFLITLILGLGLLFSSFSCVVISKNPPRRNGWIILQRQPMPTRMGNPRIKHHTKHKGNYKKSMYFFK